MRCSFVYFLAAGVWVLICPLGAVIHFRCGHRLSRAVMCLFSVTGVTHVKLLVSGALLSLLLSVWPLTWRVHSKCAARAGVTHSSCLCIAMDGTWDAMHVDTDASELVRNKTLMSFLGGIHVFIVAASSESPGFLLPRPPSCALNLEWSSALIRDCALYPQTFDLNLFLPVCFCFTFMLHNNASWSEIPEKLETFLLNFFALLLIYNKIWFSTLTSELSLEVWLSKHFPPQFRSAV